MFSLKNFFILSLFVLSFFYSTLCFGEETKKTDVESTVQCANSTDSEDRIARHKDIYFIYGDPNAKVQISLKFKLFSKADLFLAYTQTMFWNLGKESSPFEDVNYNPELFYRINLTNSGILKSIDVGLFEHLSNGKAGLDSRAFNRSYIKFNTVSHFYKWTFNWDTKVFAIYRFGLDKTNQDIGQYMGFWETKIYFVNFFDLNDFIDRAQMYFSFFSGGEISQSISKGGQELGFKIRLGGGKFNPFLFVQLYHGYNESLLNYNKESFSYRFGLSF